MSREQAKMLWFHIGLSSGPKEFFSGVCWIENFEELPSKVTTRQFECCMFGVL